MSLFVSAIPTPPAEVAGSSVWQLVFVSFAVVLILLEIVRGWRMGILRQLMRVVALIAAYATGFYGGGLLLPILRPLLKLPDFLISLIGGAILAAIVYAVIAGLGTVLFKRTAQQSSGTVRLVYGASGAFVGLFFGAFFVWLVFMGIRSVGSIAGAQMEAQPKRDPGGNMVTRSPQSPWAQSTPPISSFDPDSVTATIARLKNSVELGSLGEALKRTDLTPASVYQTLNDVGAVVANPESARRFLSFPEAAELSRHPRIVALRNDPEISDIISQGRILELLNHPRVLEAANDPSLVERVKRFDFKKALEYAAKRDE